MYQYLQGRSSLCHVSLLQKVYKKNFFYSLAPATALYLSVQNRQDRRFPNVMPSS